jgi:hypothetical protein
MVYKDIADGDNPLAPNCFALFEGRRKAENY